jgi:hypothetical protein
MQASLQGSNSNARGAAKLPARLLETVRRERSARAVPAAEKKVVARGGVVTAAGAELDYAVAITADGSRIDEARTAELGTAR